MARSNAESTGDRPPVLVGGRYEPREKLGEGAFSITYRAVDTILGRPVAIKIARAQYAADRGFVLRFEREARLAASVSHPNLVDVYDYGPHENTYFIAMQYVPGSDLRHLLNESGRLSITRAIATIRQVLAGLGAIHAVGIIHRDIKPHNVLVGPDAAAQVTDFGVAYTSIEESLTSDGTTIGTAAYMAPEQARGGALSVRTDLYAVGVMLFECLTGRLPFEAANPLAVMLAHVQRPAPRFSDVAPNLRVPPELEAVVMRAMAKDPADRFADASEMALALASVPSVDAGSADAETRQLPTTTPVAAMAAGPAINAPERHQNPPLTPSRKGISWRRIGAVLFILLALGASGAALAGIIGNRLDGESDTVRPAVLGGASPPPTSTLAGTDPTATATALAIRGMVGTATAAPEPAPTDTPSEGATPTPEPSETAISTETPPPPFTPTATATTLTISTATAAPTPTITATATSIPPPTATLAPTETPVPVDVDADDTGTAPTIASSAQRVSANASSSSSTAQLITFSSSDWSGVCDDVDASTYGRDAVAIRGSGSSCPSATLSFTLDQAPSGDTTLTVSGFNGESVPVMVAIEINGSRSAASNQFFDTWDGAASSIDANWGRAQLVLPRGYLRAGDNTISLVSTSTGSSPTDPPYLLLGEATLEL